MGQFKSGLQRRLTLFAGAAALLSASGNAAPTGTPVPPPPPGPGGCRGPSCTAVPRDELVMSIPAASPHQSAGSFDTPLIDTSNLVVQPSDVDVGVTSGADSSTWDSFAVATTNRYQSCVSESAGSNAKDRPTQSVCEPTSQDEKARQ